MEFILVIGLIILFAVSCVYVSEYPLCWFVLIPSVVILMGMYAKTTMPTEDYYLEAELYTSKDNVYIFIDNDGNFWEWEDDMYVYTDQHVYLLTMSTNNTYDTNKDDIILTVWSSGGEEIPAVG